MKPFGYYRHRRDDPMADAPPWAVEIDAKLNHLIEKVETLMALSPQVQALVDDVTANTDAVNAALAGLAAEAKQISDLQAQIAAIQPGQPIDADDLAAITAAASQLGQTNTALTAAIPANVQPATPPATA